MSLLEKLACLASRFAGTSYAFTGATGSIILWLLSGPYFAYSDTWQLVINTGTTIITFLMVFLIQRSQNKDMVAVHTKLDEIIRAISSANNCYINIESLSESEANALRERLLKMTKKIEDATPVNTELTVAEATESAAQANAEKRVADPAPGTLEGLISKNKGTANAPSE